MSHCKLIVRGEVTEASVPLACVGDNILTSSYLNRQVFFPFQYLGQVYERHKQVGPGEKKTDWIKQKENH